MKSLGIKRVMVIIALFGVLLFSGPLFDAFKQGLIETNDNYKNIVVHSGWSYMQLGQWWDREHISELRIAKKKDKNIAKTAGRIAYHRAIMTAVKNAQESDRKLGVLCTIERIFYMGGLYLEDMCVNVSTKPNTTAEALWTDKQWGPDGMTWKQWVLKEIKSKK